MYAPPFFPLRIPSRRSHTPRPRAARCSGRCGKVSPREPVSSVGGVRASREGAAQRGGPSGGARRQRWRRRCAAVAGGARAAAEARRWRGCCGVHRLIGGRWWRAMAARVAWGRRGGWQLAPWRCPWVALGGRRAPCALPWTARKGGDGGSGGGPRDLGRRSPCGAARGAPPPAFPFFLRAANPWLPRSAADPPLPRSVSPCVTIPGPHRWCLPGRDV